MCQDALFDASVYMQQAYDALVLAYSHWELSEIAMLKAAVLRGYITVLTARDEQLKFADLDENLDPV